MEFQQDFDEKGVPHWASARTFSKNEKIAMIRYQIAEQKTTMGSTLIQI